jgi:DNA-directed RNA polymerase
LRWLKIHTANKFGFDKASFEERVEWCDERYDEMQADPVAFWKGNDPGDKDRWSALAAVLDLVGTGPITTPIQVDATCSGLQHLSAMAGDEAVAVATNVMPSKDGLRNDPYITTAEACGRERAEVKQSVMCIPYGISLAGMIDQLIEEGIEPDRIEAKSLAEGIWASCEELMSGVLSIMKFLKAGGRALAEAGVRPQWTTPSGFVAVMPTAILKRRISIMDAKGNMVKTQFGVESADTVDPNQVVRGMAPNFVHSYDAALVALVVSRWDGPITCIHDCFATTASKMDALRKLIHKCFVELYGSDAILKVRNEFIHSAPLGASIPLPPVRREMDLTASLDSEYMYS